MDERPQSGILEGELETESEEAVQTGCLDCIRQTQITALALYSTSMNYLREYFKRNASESGFSSAKRITGHVIFHRRKNRIETSGFCKGLIHDLMP